MTGAVSSEARAIDLHSIGRDFEILTAHYDEDFHEVVRDDDGFLSVGDCRLRRSLHSQRNAN